MKNSFRTMLHALMVLAAFVFVGCTADKYSYETVPNDPLKARIYTLDNGLKVYMSVNEEEPRIQTYIAVRVGGKNDPAETTGLAHYFEHLMFKGTEKFGTQNFEQEKPLLDEIEKQFEVYRKTTDDAERKAIYKVIDSLSYEASKISIPNEYDKLMSAIGANGTNAYTSYDVTCYTEDIPSNQIENWAKIQADRFQNATIRGFHTELETVYEEKNMSLTNDTRKVLEKINSVLFPNHPYGTQTVLGTQEHLKNPSITNIKNYHKTWYVPNNMAICLSGDFNPDEMIAIIDKYFGQMQPNPNLPKLEFPEEKPITEPIVAEVVGLEAERIFLSWRFPGAAHPDGEKLELLSQILFNGTAGLFDLNLIQQQKVLYGLCTPFTMADYSAFIMYGGPKQGQTLEEVKDLFFAELKNLREGNFDEGLLEGILNTYKRSLQMQLESNDSRADMFVNSFVNGTNWADEVGRMDRLASITKQDIVDFANKYLNENNCAIIYKRQGVDPNEMKIDKPQITPIFMNRDTASTFLTEIQQTSVAPIEPKFLDYDKDIVKLQTASGVPVLYTPNTTNQLFELTYLFDMGNYNDKMLGIAAGYMEYLGTSDMTPEQVKSEFFRMGCSFNVKPGSERTYVSISGLAENMPKAIALFEKLMADAQANAPAYTNLVGDILKSRMDAKANQGTNFSQLRQYVTWGPEIKKTIPSAEELQTANPQELVERIHNIFNYKHRILYYGPATEKELIALLDKEHRTPETLKDIPAGVELKQANTDETKIFIAPYDAKQIYMSQFSHRNEKYDINIEPTRQMYSEYFSGGMNSIVFQEMRESRGLAYTAYAGLAAPSFVKYDYTFMSYIATQNDKMMDAIKAFNEIINEMPQSEPAFKLAKEAIIARLRTERVNKSSILWNYVNAQDMNRTEDIRKLLYEKIQTMTLQDVIKFQQEWVKGRTYHYGILGKKEDLDMEALKKMGTVVELTTEDIFGY